MAFRQIELVYRIFHRKAHGAVVFGAQVVRLKKPLVPLRGRIDGIEVRLNEAFPRKAARLRKQREVHFRVVVEPIFRSARRAADSLLGDNARMLEALLQQRVRIRQATPLGALLPKSAPLPALGANGRPMSTTAGLGVFGSGGAFVGAVGRLGTRDRIIGSGGVGRGFPSGSGNVGRSFPSGSSILVGIAAFVVAMAFVGAMLVFGKLVL